MHLNFLEVSSKLVQSSGSGCFDGAEADPEEVGHFPFRHPDVMPQDDDLLFTRGNQLRRAHHVGPVPQRPRMSVRALEARRPR